MENKVIRFAEALQDGASDEVERARLLAARDKDSGAWLQTLPITSVGLRVDDDTLRTAVGLRLGQDGASDEVERARLLAARDKDSGAWLQALPITSVGLRMDDDTLRTAVGLRLGTAICAPHNCQLCGAQVSQFDTHGLS